MVRLWRSRTRIAATRRIRSGNPAPRPALNPAWLLAALQLLDAVKLTGDRFGHDVGSLAVLATEVKAEAEVEVEEKTEEVAGAGDWSFVWLKEDSGAIVYPENHALPL